MNDAAIDDVCASFQRSSFEHVRARVNRALDYVRYKKIPVSALVVVGGVAANEKLRSYVSFFFYFFLYGKLIDLICFINNCCAVLCLSYWPCGRILA